MSTAAMGAGIGLLFVALVIYWQLLGAAFRLARRIRRRRLERRGWCLCDARPFVGEPHKHYGRYKALR